jgi:hypothetical protein
MLDANGMHEQYGRYGLLRRLAVGGMAEIFLAALHGDAGFEKRVVLKRILPHLGEDTTFVRMFIDEAMVASKLSHPNIIQVYDFGHAAGSYYMAMELVDGIDLHQLLQRAQARQRPLTVAEVAAIGERIARGLAYTHNLTDEQGEPQAIVHRDVSPHNVMLSTLGEVKVMDFGIAKAAARATMTLTGTIKGKLAYMSPEQARGESATKWSDQFALGIVLWELLCGRKLFHADTEVTLIQKVSACDVPLLGQVRPDVPDELCAIIHRALHPQAAHRYSDLSELADALTAVRYNLGREGIVKLDSLAREFTDASPGAQNWSWAQQQVAEGAGQTRVLSRPGHAHGGVQHALAEATPRTRVLRAASLPVRAQHTARRAVPRHRLSAGTRPMEQAQGHLPWVVVGFLLLALAVILGSSTWPKLPHVLRHVQGDGLFAVFAQALYTTPKIMVTAHLEVQIWPIPSLA